jgi:hypothetical protein
MIISRLSGVKCRTKGENMQYLLRRHFLHVSLVIMLIAGIGWASREEIFKDDFDHELLLVNGYPRVGEVFEVLYRVRLKEDAQPKPNVQYYMQFKTGSSYQAEVLIPSEIAVTHFTIPGEWKEFHGKYIIHEPFKMTILNAMLRKEGGGYGTSGAMLVMYLVDSITGQYGTLEEIRCTPEKNPELFYDPDQDLLFPQHERVDPYIEKENKDFIIAIEEVHPGLTKWEKIHLLHDVMYYPRRSKVKMSHVEAAIEFLDAGWLDAYQAGPDAREKWLEDLYNKSRSNPSNENPGK